MFALKEQNENMYDAPAARAKNTYRAGTGRRKRPDRTCSRYKLFTTAGDHGNCVPRF